jgi:hypothetical protein
MKETPRFLAGTALIVCCLTLAGCSTGDAARTAEAPGIVQELSFWQPYLLYILASPHPRLYVEIDVVEGCAPSEAALNNLRNVLASYLVERESNDETNDSSDDGRCYRCVADNGLCTTQSK